MGRERRAGWRDSCLASAAMADKKNLDPLNAVDLLILRHRIAAT